VDENDEDLLDRYKAGDTEALAVLVERYRRPLYSFILRMSSFSDADEIFQEVWLRVIHKAGAYRRDRFRGWVYRITHNLMIDRARGRQPTISLDQLGDNGQGAPWMEGLQAKERSPSAAAKGTELGRHIRAAVEQLSPEQREVFLLRVENDIPFNEIARVQGVSINTALSRMQYALAKLRKLLHEDHKELEQQP
jgi:RNA polymerase sigma-70 factor (ECF subfamily)